MLALDGTTLFAYLRRSPFGGRLTQQTVDGVNSILTAWQQHTNSKDIRWLAYILATAFHETGGRMAPVREGFASTDAKARKIVAKRRYGKPDATTNGKLLMPLTGHVFYGRGYAQLTWADNYQLVGEAIKMNLRMFPDLALNPDVAGLIIVRGMIEGMFTGKTLAQYFNVSTDDPEGARSIVNGTDKAKLIAGYYRQFLDALLAAETKTPQPTDVTNDEAKPDGTPLLKDQTTLGAGAIGVGGVGAVIIGAVQNEWGALVAITLIIVGAYLFYKGRLDLRDKKGA